HLTPWAVATSGTQPRNPLASGLVADPHALRMDRRIQEGRGEDRYETADHDDDRTLVRSLRPEDEQSKDRKEKPVPSASGDADRDLLSRSSSVRASRRSIHSIPSPQDASSKAT